MRFAAITGLLLLFFLLATGPLWSSPLLGEGNDTWSVPLAIAVAAYVGVAALNGILAGANAWASFSTIPIIDGVLRLVLVLIVLWQGWGGLALAWAVAIPFPVSLAIVLIWQRRLVQKNSEVRESYKALAANSSRTMLASAATALLVNGFPVVLALFGQSDAATLGAVVLALTLTRAPILVPLTALQSMLIARFSSNAGNSRRFMGIVVLGIVVAAFVIALVAGLWGEALLGLVFGGGFEIRGELLFGFVIASGCLGVLTVTGSAVLAEQRHNWFALGWVVAAAVAVILVALLPLELGLRSIAALIVGPLLGAACHLASKLAKVA